MAHQSPGLHQELAQVRQRIQSGKQKLASLERELQDLAKRTASVRSELDADEQREAQLLSALTGHAPAPNGTAAGQPPVATPVQLPGPAAGGVAAAGQPTAVQGAPPAAGMAAPVAVTFQPNGPPPPQQHMAAAPAYLSPPTPAAASAAAPGAAPASAAAATAPYQPMNPGAAAFQPGAAAPTQGFVPRAVQLQHGAPVAVSMQPPPGFQHPAAAPVLQQQVQQQALPMAPKRTPPGFWPAQQAQQPQQAQHAPVQQAQQQQEAEAGPPKPVQKSPLAAFPMPGRSMAPAQQPEPPQPQAPAPAALEPQPPPLPQQQQGSASAAAPQDSGVPLVAGSAPAAQLQLAGCAESVEDLNAAMEAAALANADAAPHSAAEAEAEAEAASAARRRQPPQQQQPSSKKKGGWGRGAGAASGNGGGAQAPASAPGAPLADAVSGEYEALLAGSYDRYVRNQHAAPEWQDATDQMEQDFPALGAPIHTPAPAPPPKADPAPAPAARAAPPPLAANGGAWGGNPWSSGSLKDRLARSGSGGSGNGGGGSWGGGAAGLAQQALQQAQQAQQQAQQAPVEEFEARCGLRVPGDGTPDAVRRRQTRKQTFTHNEKHISMRREVNVVEGIELHSGLLSAEEQQLVIDAVERWVGLGKAGQLLGRTFSAPKKWLPGKGRMTIQFGCCYNYARDAEGRDPGIIPEEVVEPMPPLLRALCRRLTRWGILPAAREPNSAIINIYEAGDCIPPHVDHFDFVRPFCTVSLLSTQCIMFAQKLVPAGPGEFVAREGCSPVNIPLPPGSVCVLKGYGGDKAMHCVPPVAARRISITLRKIGPDHEPAVLRERQQYERLHGPLDAAKLAPY